MALFRALESSRPPHSRLFSDGDACLFLTGQRQWLARAATLPGARGLVEWLIDRSSPGARAAGVVRTHWIDQEAAAVLKTVRQLVLVGAGFDMRAFRLPEAAQALTFELDHPQTSAAKQAALSGIRPTLPGHVRYIGMDFNRESIREVLPNAGFDASRPACWIWEGVTNYLTSEAVDAGFRQIAETSAEASVLLFTYVDQALLDHPDRFPGGSRLLVRLASYGEPWTFGLDPRDLKPYLEARRFTLLKDLNVAEALQNTGRPDLSTRGYEFYRIASARIGL